MECINFEKSIEDESITFPGSTTSIGKSAFGDCGSRISVFAEFLVNWLT